MRTNVKQMIERVIMQDKKEVRVNNESEMCEEIMNNEELRRYVVRVVH